MYLILVILHMHQIEHLHTDNIVEAPDNWSDAGLEVLETLLKGVALRQSQVAALLTASVSFPR